MICPNCPHTLTEDVSFHRGIFKCRKITQYTCIACDFKKEVEIKISHADYEATMKAKSRGHNTEQRHVYRT